MALPLSAQHVRHQLLCPQHILWFLCGAAALYSIAVFHIDVPSNDPFDEADTDLSLRNRRIHAIEATYETNSNKDANVYKIKNPVEVEKTLSEHWKWGDTANDNEANDTKRNSGLLSHCPPDLTDDQCKAMIPPHIGYKKVMVTGGAGFIGSHVAEFLLARGDDVVIVDKMNHYYDVRIKEANLKLLRDKYPSEKRLSIYRGDICDAAFMSKIFESEKPQWVCHMAARAGVRPSIQDPYIYIESNIRGSTQLMELSHKHGVRNFVFASSSSVYGGSKSTFFSEQEPVDNPISPYAASKKATELFSYTFHHLYKLNMTGLRFFTVYGPRGRPDMAPFIFVDRVSKGRQIKQFGDGSSSRDYTYISDIVDGIVRSIDRPHTYQVFNLGKGLGTQLKDFIHIVEKHTGKKANVVKVLDQPGDVPYTCANVTKAHLLLGYQAKVPIEEGIRRTVEWYNETYLSAVTAES